MMAQACIPQELKVLLDRLKEYGFTDQLGHPLENCLDFQELISLYSKVYGKMVQGEQTRIESQVDTLKAEIEKYKIDADVELERMKTNLSTLLAKKEMAMNTLDNQAKIKAQIIAAMGSNVNYGASISANHGESINHNFIAMSNCAVLCIKRALNAFNKFMNFLYR